jgi:hypothetical protein
MGAAVAIEICGGHGLRSRAIGNVKINRLAPAIALRREKSKNRVTSRRRGRKWRQNAANFVMLPPGNGWQWLSVLPVYRKDQPGVSCS